MEDLNQPKTNSKSVIILIALGILNMAVVVGAGLMIQKARKKADAEAQAALALNPVVTPTPVPEKPFVSKIIPVETLIVNLQGNTGRRIVKINLDLELEGPSAPQEIIEKKVQIRDRLIVTLSDLTYDVIQTKEGKDNLRETMRDNLNEILTKAKVKQVYITDIIYN